MLSPPLLGAIILGARQYVRRKGRAAPIPWTQPRGRCGLYKCRNLPHCSRRSRLKFFAKLFFKKAGKFFAEAFFRKSRSAGGRQARMGSGQRPHRRFWPAPRSPAHLLHQAQHHKE
ncbi:hypothetical protein FMM72_09685 [Anaerotruncus colihominis]|uniref:Uncharacterized protein n=1 Tax=Anaerotruncus colihominis TaxID=169435 RepID=A0A845SYD6_9FIRM|nr:hypothetical protein [Anaerotruncus colihominis]